METEQSSITSSLEWELEEGVPQFEDNFIQKYLQGRDSLIEEEKKQRHGEIRRAKLASHTVNPHCRLCLQIDHVTNGGRSEPYHVINSPKGAERGVDQGF